MPDLGAPREGTPVTPLDVDVTLAEVVKYLDAAGNMLPIFYDAEAARAQGLEGTIVPGPMKLSLLVRMLLEWLGGAAEIREIRCAYRRPDHPGRLHCGGTVTRSYEAADETLIDCEIWIENERGERTVSGAAVLKPVG